MQIQLYKYIGIVSMWSQCRTSYTLLLVCNHRLAEDGEEIQGKEISRSSRAAGYLLSIRFFFLLSLVFHIPALAFFS